MKFALSSWRLLSIAILIAGGIVVAYMWRKAGDNKVAPTATQKGSIYDADIPPFDKLPWDSRLMVLSPSDLAKAPTADFFTSPLGSESGAFTYDAQPFGTDNAKRGGKHYGQDLNGIGGMDTDLGDPVYAAGRGLVVYCGEPSPEWGKVVVLLHRLPDGGFLQSLYAHLDRINILYGDLVARGQVIGTVGTANGNYPAHLHFEMMHSIVNEAGMEAYGPTTGNRIDPNTILRQKPLTDTELIPDPLIPLKEMQLREDFGSINLQIVPAKKQR